MMRPNVLNIVTDPSRNCVYEILAFRTLTINEAYMAVGRFATQNGGMGRNEVITIITMIS